MNRISTKKKKTFPVLVLVTGLLLAGLFTVSAGGRKEDVPKQKPTRDTRESTRIEIREPSAGDTSAQKKQAPSKPETPSQPQIPENAVAINRPAWVVSVHERTGNMQKEISQTIDTGYIPVGMEVDTDGSFTILYTATVEMVPERWIIESYKPVEVNRELTTRLLEGWSPLGFSVLNDNIVLMYGTGAPEIDAWRIHQTKLDEKELLATINGYQEDGYSLVDISIDPEDDVLWYLFVQQDGRPSGSNSRFFLNAYPKGEDTIAGISTDYTAGRGMPYGIAIGDSVSLVPFVTWTDDKE